MVKADNFIYWIILYPVDKRFSMQVICFICYLMIHPLDNLPVFCITGARKFENPDILFGEWGGGSVHSISGEGRSGYNVGTF